MTSVATLICNPAAAALDAATLTRVRAVLPCPDQPVWLDPGIAADIGFETPPQGDRRALATRIRAALGGLPVDVVLQEATKRRKKLFLADMDSTMIEQECIDELADHVGKRDFVAAITERAMRGELAFAPALRERVALLKGLPQAIIDDVIAHRITLTPGGRTLVATLRANGVYTCLVSGGFTQFTATVANRIGFDEDRGNVLEVDGAGRLTGTIREPILGQEAKQATLIELRDRHGLADYETMAVGDGANDLAMIGIAGLGVAFRAKPVVAEQAAARIDHGDLTALLYIQGYRRDEFAV
jgi:phosphoserine phosphatase